MTSELSVKTSQLKASEQDTIKEMVRIYQDAYRNDKTIQLEYIVPQLIQRMPETITLRIQQPESEFIIARAKASNQVIGWLALVFKREHGKQISEEHVLLSQYALLPDMAAKAKNAGIGAAEIKGTAHKLQKAFKDAREVRLREKHCLIGTLVVDPGYQNRGVASALLARAISLSEIFASPIWVPAPEACRGLFEKHLFEEVGEYRLDLNEHVPKPDDRSKGKAQSVSSLGSYVWKFMLRKEPLENAIRAYESSIAFAEQEADKWVEVLEYRKRKERERRSKVAAKKKGKAEAGDTHFEGDNQRASGGSSVAPNDAGEVPSSPLLVKASSSGNQEAVALEKEAQEALYP